MKRRFVLTSIALTLAMSSAVGQDRPVRVIVPSPAGGNADNLARLYAEGLAARLGQTVIVENKPGAGAVIGAQATIAGPADGTVLFLAPTAAIVVAPHLRSLPYDPLKDLVPVAQLTSWMPLLAVRKDFPANNMAELVAAAKKEPDRFSFASAGPGTMTHLMGELINNRFGIKLVHVPYKGSAEFMADLLSGRVDAVFDSVVLPHVQSGQLKPIVSMASVRHPALPGVPTISEAGLKLDIPNWFAVFAPRGTPPAVVDRLSAASKAVVDGFDAGKLEKMNMAASYVAAAPFKAQIAQNDALMQDIIKSAGVKGE